MTYHCNLCDKDGTKAKHRNACTRCESKRIGEWQKADRLKKRGLEGFSVISQQYLAKKL